MPTILSVRIDDLTPDEAVSRCQGFIQEGGAHQVVTVNPEFVVAAQDDAEFTRVLANADLSVPDGAGLLLAARWLGTPLRARVTGVDLSRRLAELAARRGYHLFLLGAAPGVAQRAADRLVADHPGLHIAGVYAGSPDPAEELSIIALVRAAAPQILLVAYGAPAQDKWIARNLERLDVPVCVGVGGVLDYLAGAVPYAPAWLRRLGLEWLYRVIRQPRRWRRIWRAVVVFPWLVLTRGRRGAPQAGSNAGADSDNKG
jgi:N-acetylglucosaminyldiphosphoundecaprenol N-acetyl-beta-D-mannosaminyltransferase